MSTNISERGSLSKFGAFLFVRQTPLLGAERHKGWLQQLVDWRARRMASSELSALSDRELADIGLTRQEIPAAIGRRR
jgi:uncharacterized protein YjiS (DUF1127 family)